MKFENPLNKYRTYSYFFGIAICDSTKTAQTLAASADISAWQHNEIDSDDPNVYYAPKTIDNTGKYTILLNGATDAKFVVYDAKWSTITSAEAVFGDMGDSIALEGTMKISEPRGVTFTDDIITCYKLLDIDVSAAVFLIKPFFTGFTDQGEYEIISSIRPIYALLIDLRGTFSEIGGMYELDFISHSNSLSRLQQYSKVTGLCVQWSNPENANEQPTVEYALNATRDKLQKHYEDYYKCIKDADSKLLPANSIVPVIYSFGCDEDLKPLKLSWPAPCTENGCENSKFVYTAPLGASIETVFHEIMRATQEVKDNKLKMPGTDIPASYKILSAVIFNRTDDELKDVWIVYWITKYASAKSPFDIANQLNVADEKTKQELETHVLEFDYLYSGNNIDILDFDIKMNLGMAYLQTASSINSLRKQNEAYPTRYMNPNPSIPFAERFGYTSKFPLLLDMQQPTVVTNNGPTGLAKTLFTLSNHAALEVLDSNVTIRGNPYLLGNANILSDPALLQSVTSDLSWLLASIGNTEDPLGTKEQNYPIQRFDKYPCLARINIYMPQSNDDLTLFQKNEGYRKKFWFPGYFYVYEIEHNFNDDGTFTQVLKMIAIPDKLGVDEVQGIAERSDDSEKLAQTLKDCLKSTCGQ